MHLTCVCPLEPEAHLRQHLYLLAACICSLPAALQPKRASAAAKSTYLQRGALGTLTVVVATICGSSQALVQLASGDQSLGGIATADLSKRGKGEQVVALAMSSKHRHGLLGLQRTNTGLGQSPAQQVLTTEAAESGRLQHTCRVCCCEVIQHSLPPASTAILLVIKN